MATSSLWKIGERFVDFLAPERGFYYYYRYGCRYFFLTYLGTVVILRDYLFTPLIETSRWMISGNPPQELIVNNAKCIATTKTGGRLFTEGYFLIFGAEEDKPIEWASVREHMEEIQMGKDAPDIDSLDELDQFDEIDKVYYMIEYTYPGETESWRIMFSEGDEISLSMLDSVETLAEYRDSLVMKNNIMFASMSDVSTTPLDLLQVVKMYSGTRRDFYSQIPSQIPFLFLNEPMTDFLLERSCGDNCKLITTDLLGMNTIQHNIHDAMVL